MLSDEELLQLAGAQALQRGRAYHRERRIVLARRDADWIEGEAAGSDLYELCLRRDGGEWVWDCTCPAADDGSFCKHLVAAVLTARDGDTAAVGNSGEPVPAPRKRRAGQPASADDLETFLRAQSVERLAEWLLAFADEDATIEKRLRLFQAADSPAELKAALGRMLDASGFLDRRRSLAYARRLDAVVAQLEDAVRRDATSGRALCEYVIGRLLKIYGRSDDSAGSIGDQLHAIVAVHAQACAAAPLGKAFAKALLALQQQDQWGLFPLTAYWEALGLAGQIEYGRRVVAEFEALPAKGKAPDRWSPGVSANLRRAEDLARASGDFALLQRVLRRDLTNARQYGRVLESLLEFDRPREALAWAEQAVAKFPQDDDLRGALAECLASAGLESDAVEQAWQAFRLSPDPRNWNDLKRHAGAAWPTWRERALAEVAAREPAQQASLRAGLLDHDGDFDGAVALASTHAIRPNLLESFARRLERGRPALAGAFYLRVAEVLQQSLDYGRYPELVRLLKRAAACLPAAEWQAVVAQVRVDHGRKTRLMTMLTDAGL
jgi:tetratricopeptide (TPR) repeat protein